LAASGVVLAIISSSGAIYEALDSYTVERTMQLKARDRQADLAHSSRTNQVVSEDKAVERTLDLAYSTRATLVAADQRMNNI
jgi:hypothetical protein